MSAAPELRPDWPALPSSAETEQAILGCLIRDNACIPAIFAAVEPGDFYHAPHPQIATAAFQLHAEGRPVTPLTLRAAMGADSAYLEIGGIHGYAADMTAAAPVENPVPLVRIIVDLARRREALLACQSASEDIAAGRPLGEALAPALDIARRATVAGRVAKTVAGTAAEILREAEDALAGKPVPRVTTGLSALDGIVGGLQAGDFCVYAGRPGMGKSSALAMTALASARSGRPCILFSLEMTQKALLQRMGCDIDYDSHPRDPLSYSWFRDGHARSHQIERMALALREIPATLEIVEDGGLDIHKIAALAECFAAKHSGMGIVVIDYLQKIRASQRYAGNKVQEVTEISGCAKALALRMGWPVLVGAQLNRGVEARGERRPELSDLRESGAIEQDADQVIGLYREAYYRARQEPARNDPNHPTWRIQYDDVKNNLLLSVLKNRHGPEGTVTVYCDMRASAVRDMNPEKDARL